MRNAIRCHSEAEKRRCRKLPTALVSENSPNIRLMRFSGLSTSAPLKSVQHGVASASSPDVPSQSGRYFSHRFDLVGPHESLIQRSTRACMRWPPGVGGVQSSTRSSLVAEKYSAWLRIEHVELRGFGGACSSRSMDRHCRPPWLHNAAGLLVASITPQVALAFCAKKISAAWLPVRLRFLSMPRKITCVLCDKSGGTAHPAKTSVKARGSAQPVRARKRTITE